jgi:CRP-like cAMP-binding protein
MSAFDKRVCQWLNEASISVKSKQTLVNRMHVGINNYRNLELEKLALPGMKQYAAENRIDYALQEQIQKALFRLQEGDGGSAEAPLFSFKSAAAAPRYAPRSPAQTPRPTTAAAAPVQSEPLSVSQPPEKLEEEEDHNDVANGGEEDQTTMDTFTFGAAADETADSPFGEPMDEGDNVDDGELDEREDYLRRAAAKRQSRNAVSAAPMDLAMARSVRLNKVEKNPDIVNRLVKVLESHYLFAHLEDEEIAQVAESMKVVTANRGEKIALKGHSNDTMYVVTVGSVTAEGSEQRIHVGGCFGEIGLMYDVQLTESYEAAVAATQLCTIDRATYQAVCMTSSQEKRERYEGFLSGVETLKMLTPTERLQIADGLKTSKYTKGEKLIRHGQEGAWFFLIVDGSVDVIGRDADTQAEVYVCTFGAGHPVGELEILHKHTNVADVVASSDTVKVAKMTARHFEKMIGSAKEFLERQAADDEVYSYYRQTQRRSLGGDEHQ